MAFKVLDINKSPREQGFKEQSYDLIVASMVLHATDILETTMRNVRCLLKPGGYLIMLEGLPDADVRFGAIFGAFPGWWAGADDGRILSPLVNVAGWDKILRQTGFSGCDTSTPNPDPLVAPLTVIVSQAVDDRITLLRDPLSQAPHVFASEKLMEELIIVDRNAPQASSLTGQVKALLAPHYTGLRSVRSIADIQPEKMSDKHTLLCLSDLDECFFKDPTQASWEALRGILLRVRNILWVTHSRRLMYPHANMIVGLLRSAPREIPTLTTQFLDFADVSKVEARTIAETLLRLQEAAYWQREDAQQTFLNSIEPEIMLDHDSRALVPRLKVNGDMNRRYNSARRTVLANVDMNSEGITIVRTDSGYILHQQPSLTFSGRTGLLRTSHSLLSATQTAPCASLFVQLGQHHGGGDQEVFLSTELASNASAWDQCSVSVDIEPGLEADFLSNVAHHMLASAVLERRGKDDQVVVLAANLPFEDVLTWRARNVGVKVTFVTLDLTSTKANRIKIHPTAADRDIQNLLPDSISMLLDLTEARSGGLSDHRFRSMLSKGCRQENLKTLFPPESEVPRQSQVEIIRNRFRDAVNHAHYSLAETENARRTIPTVTLGDLRESESKANPLAILDWTTSQEIVARVLPVDSYMKFPETKTYWLAGLSHGLGLSLCEWMVRHGAKHVVISSRRPIVDKSWLAKMFAASVCIRVYSCDVTNEADVRKTHADIVSNMPPIGGVTQGAMVLDDVSIGDMTFDQLGRVTEPKVEGSLHLNNLFNDKALDFFVFFSSASAVVGYTGQSNYSAANLFMSALAEQRRERGLAASVINIGPVLGVGYIAQQDIDLTASVNSREGMFLSEQDFHQLFAEAILAGRPGALGPIEITTGVGRIGSQSDVRPAWASNPIMSHYIRNDESTEVATSDTRTTVPLRTLLQQAVSRDGVYRVLQEAFIVKLSALYQLPVDKLAREDSAQLNLNEMGTDSLLATEIRGWFVRTLQVNIPVLKILSGTTVHELLKTATETIPPTWIPNVSASDTSVSDHPVSRSLPAPPPPPAAAAAAAASSPVAFELWRRELDDDEPSTSDDQACDTPEEFSGKYETRPSSVPSEADTDQKSAEFEHEKAPDLAFQKMTKLSLGQDMFWFVLMFLQDKSSLNHTASFRLFGQIRHQDFEDALQSVGQQHEILRACFFQQDAKPVQAILPSSTIRGEYRDIQHEDEVTSYVQKLEQHSFDIAHGETLKVSLLSLSPTTHFLVMCAHSLVVDGLSFRIFLDDLQKHYTHAQQPRETPQYLDFAAAQHLRYETGQYAEELRYWKTEFSTFPDPLPILSLGKNISRPALTTFENERSNIRLGAKTKGRIRTLCRQSGVTPFHFHLTVFRALLARYTDVEDVSIGIGDANRTDEDMMNSIGPFVNLLPLRFQTKKADRFDKLLKETRMKTLGALAHSKVPFQVLLNELGAPRSATCTPIFQCFVDYRLGQKEKIAWADCQLEMLSFQVSKLAYDIALDIIDDPDGDCVAMLIVRKDLYSQRDAEYLMQSYERLVNSFVTDLSTPLDEPEIFAASDIDKAIGFGQGPSQRRVWPETMIHRIDDVIEQRQNEIAVRWDNDKVTTYSEIQARMNTIAKTMQTANISVGSRVATLLEPTDTWISSILAILRLGAVYMPLDQGNSWSRLAVMMQDCLPSLLLVDDDTEQFVQKFCPAEVQVINVSRLVMGKYPSIPVAATSDGVATLLYTSGSSGTPKGIVLKHEGFRNWLESTAQVYDIDSEVILQQSSSGFDMSLIQVFTALCLGGSLYLVPRRLRGDACAISKLIYSQGITYTFSCTSELFSWFKYGDSDLLSRSKWRRAITGGEPGVDRLFKEFAYLEKAELRMFHAYGPTEISWTATTMELFYNSMKDNLSCQNIAVGYPLPNYNVYVLDKDMNPVPPGIQGEIFIGGPGVATGYLNNDSLTKERFVPDIFTTPEYRRRGWNTLHRTGDLGRWGEAGALFIEGRISGDTQIKLRGLRIDLQEVERALINAADGALSEAVVSVSQVEPDSPQFLVAHVVFDPSQPDNDRSKLLDTLPARLGLPRYMCPSAIIPLDQMPLTNTLKLDRRSIAMLPLPEITHTQNSELSETESQLKPLWEDVVSGKIANLHNIEPGTDFFHIGGTSLLLLDLQMRIQKTFQIQLSLIQMFNASTLAGMALLIENKGAQHPSQKLINWDQETNLTSALLGSSPSLSGIRFFEPTTIVLTGSTGYLGQGILEALIRDRDIEKIHCIAVRDAGSRKAIYCQKKVTVYDGDLALPRLGLSSTEVEDIFGSADVIIHNGADVSYMKTYASLRLPNLKATKTLAEMSLHRRIPFHYISSGGACSFAAAAGCREIGPISVARFPPPSDGQPGYTSSKWASEVFLEKLADHHKDWPIWVHRPSNIARTDTPQLDLVYNLQQYSRLLKAVPIARGKAHGALDSVTLDAVVKGVLETVKGLGRENNNNNNNNGSVHFLHHLGGVELPMDDLRSWIVNTGGLSAEDVEEIPFDQWNRRAAEKGMNAALIGFLQMFASHGGFKFPKLVKSGRMASLEEYDH